MGRHKPPDFLMRVTFASAQAASVLTTDAQHPAPTAVASGQHHRRQVASAAGWHRGLPAWKVEQAAGREPPTCLVFIAAFARGRSSPPCPVPAQGGAKPLLLHRQRVPREQPQVSAAGAEAFSEACRDTDAHSPATVPHSSSCAGGGSSHTAGVSAMSWLLLH